MECSLQDGGFTESGIYLLQFPSFLPSSGTEKGKSILEVDGRIGEIKLLQNGQMICQIGDIKFSVSEGTDSSFLQALVALHINEQQAVEIGEVSKKFIIQPEIF
jgi:hypothetical protein